MRISDWSSDVCSSDLAVTATGEYHMRPSGRAPDEMRVITMEPGFTIHAEGSCLVSFGNTRVLCTASVEERVPPFLRGRGEGWVTGEYGMLPREIGRAPSELQSLMRISYAVICLKKKKNTQI